MPLEILLIEPDETTLDHLIPEIQAAGFGVVHTDDFLDGVALLREREFVAVVTAHRLGAHNGLHVVLRARREHPRIVAIVTTAAPDPVLEREAASFGARAVIAPWEHRGALLEALASSGLQIA